MQCSIRRIVGIFANQHDTSFTSASGFIFYSLEQSFIHLTMVTIFIWGLIEIADFYSVALIPINVDHLCMINHNNLSFHTAAYEKCRDHNQNGMVHIYGFLDVDVLTTFDTAGGIRLSGN